jgi:hypothetical protein
MQSTEETIERFKAVPAGTVVTLLDATGRPTSRAGDASEALLKRRADQGWLTVRVDVARLPEFGLPDLGLPAAMAGKAGA